MLSSPAFAGSQTLYLVKHLATIVLMTVFSVMSDCRVLCLADSEVVIVLTGVELPLLCSSRDSIVHDLLVVCLPRHLSLRP